MARGHSLRVPKTTHSKLDAIREETGIPKCRIVERIVAQYGDQFRARHSPEGPIGEADQDDRDQDGDLAGLTI